MLFYLQFKDARKSTELPIFIRDQVNAELGAEYKCESSCSYNDLSSASWSYEKPEFTADFTSGTLSMTLDLIPTVEITTTVGLAGVVTAAASSTVGFTVRNLLNMSL
jgi:hypothetical protein